MSDRRDGETPAAAPLAPDATVVVARAEALAGRTLAEIAAGLALALPASFARHKGFAGELVERALGLPRRSSAGPDLPSLEVKTLPIGPRGESRESTFVCVAPRDALEAPWAASVVRKKLARVLFVPVEGAHAPGAARRVGSAFVWEPSPEEDALLARDWDDLAAHAVLGGEAAVPARIGAALQIRPKGRNAAERRPRRDEEGALAALPPRGFYLRRSFTTSILRTRY